MWMWIWMWVMLRLFGGEMLNIFGRLCALRRIYIDTRSLVTEQLRL